MTLPFEKLTSSPEETELVGEGIAKAIESDPSLPRFVAMFGDLGVGKTAFVRGFARVFSPASAVRSPTFALFNEYSEKNGKPPVYHFDMYRITDEDDLYSIGFDDYLMGKGVCITEWSENIGFALPEEYIRVEIVKTSDSRLDERRITAALIK